LIGDLAYNVDCLNQKYLIQQEAHVAVLETMRNHSNSNDAAIQEIACVALRCLARASRNIISIAASGGIVTILQTMRKHGTVATLQIEGFKALFNLAFDPANQESIVVECQGLDVVRDAFVYHVDNPHVCEFGANLLHNLAFKNSKNKLRISQHGMIKMILSAMSNHPQATKVIIEACRALMSLAFAAECQNVIAECGGIEQVFQSMTLLKESKDVQVEGCKVLCTMALNHMPNKDAIVEGMGTIISAMANHAQASDMQSEGCAALATLSFRNPANKQRISEAGGIDVILNAMKTHSTIADVQIDACKALASLAFDTQLQQSIAEKGGAAVIVASMTAHLKEEKEDENKIEKKRDQDK